jgi:hypothetical protein
MKKVLNLIISFSMVFVFFTLNTPKTEASGSNKQLVLVDTGVVKDYTLSISVDPNDPDLKNTIYAVGEHQYKVENLKLVEVPNSSLTLSSNKNVENITPLATDPQYVTLKNGQLVERMKSVYAGTTVYSGSSGPAELRRMRIRKYDLTILSEITSDAPSIGCQKTVSTTDKYRFDITNYSASTQTWYWEITF